MQLPENIENKLYQLRDTLKNAEAGIATDDTTLDQAAEEISQATTEKDKTLENSKKSEVKDTELNTAVGSVDASIKVLQNTNKVYKEVLKSQEGSKKELIPKIDTSRIKQLSFSTEPNSPFGKEWIALITPIYNLIEQNKINDVETSSEIINVAVELNNLYDKKESELKQKVQSTNTSSSRKNVASKIGHKDPIISKKTPEAPLVLTGEYLAARSINQLKILASREDRDDVSGKGRTRYTMMTNAWKKREALEIASQQQVTSTESKDVHKPTADTHTPRVSFELLGVTREERNKEIDKQMAEVEKKTKTLFQKVVHMKEKELLDADGNPSAYSKLKDEWVERKVEIQDLVSQSKANNKDTEPAKVPVSKSHDSETVIIPIPDQVSEPIVLHDAMTMPEEEYYANYSAANSESDEPLKPLSFDTDGNNDLEPIVSEPLEAENDSEKKVVFMNGVSESIKNRLSKLLQVGGHEVKELVKKENLRKCAIGLVASLGIMFIGKVETPSGNGNTIAGLNFGGTTAKKEVINKVKDLPKKTIPAKSVEKILKQQTEVILPAGYMSAAESTPSDTIETSIPDKVEDEIAPPDIESMLSLTPKRSFKGSEAITEPFSFLRSEAPTSVKDLFNAEHLTFNAETFAATGFEENYGPSSMNRNALIDRSTGKPCSWKTFYKFLDFDRLRAKLPKR